MEADMFFVERKSVGSYGQDRTQQKQFMKILNAPTRFYTSKLHFEQRKRPTSAFDHLLCLRIALESARSFRMRFAELFRMRFSRSFSGGTTFCFHCALDMYFGFYSSESEFSQPSDRSSSKFLRRISGLVWHPNLGIASFLSDSISNQRF